MTRLLIATTNVDKLREIRAILGHLPVEILTLEDVCRLPEPEETGTTFAQNAQLKAYYYDHCVESSESERPYTVAEDSGLVIDALDGDPGVHSARYLGPAASYRERFAEIDSRLSKAPAATRRARFVCALAVVHNGHLIFETTGTVEGEVADHARGTGGFGYDPIFYYPPYGKTLGEVTDDEKRRVAHRGEAFRRFAIWLEKRM